MIDKAACLNSIAEALRDLGYGAEVLNVGDHFWIKVFWEGNELSGLRLEKIFQHRDTRHPGSQEQVTEVMMEIVEWKITTAVQFLPDGLVNLESLPEYYEDMREELEL